MDGKRKFMTLSRAVKCKNNGSNSILTGTVEAATAAAAVQARESLSVPAI